MRYRRALATVAALVPLLGVGVRADAGGHGPRLRTFKFETTSGAATASTPLDACDSAGHCVRAQTATLGAFGGDLSGTGVGATALTLSEQGILVLMGTSTAVGGIRQCGEGTFVFTTSGALDLNTGSMFTTVVEIVPGTGTGALEGLTGRFVGTVDLNDPAGVTTASGWVRCRPRST